MGILFNKKELVPVRRALRTNGTPAEAVLWSALSGRKAGGLKFRRQHSVGPFILDLYCPGKKLCVEVDGASHENPTAGANDIGRDAYLASLGIRTLRFSNAEVLSDVEAVVEVILAALKR